MDLTGLKMDNSQQNQNLNDFFEEVKEAIQAALLDDKNLWTSARCAAYLGYSTRYFKRAIATLKGFPAPIILPTAGRGGDERYEPKEVKEWARRYQK